MTAAASPVSGATRPPRLHLSVSAQGGDGGVCVVRADGRIDTLNSPELDQIMAALIRQGRSRLIVDLAGVEYVSSAGWGIFISRLREVREGGGDIKLARMTQPVRDIYDLLEFAGVLHHYERIETAERAFNGGHTEPDPAADRLPFATHHHNPISVAESPSKAVGLADAILGFVFEDPFYSIREIVARLHESGGHRVGWWAVWLILRRQGLLRQKSRFRYYRRRAMGAGLDR